MSKSHWSPASPLDNVAAVAQGVCEDERRRDDALVRADLQPLDHAPQGSDAGEARREYLIQADAIVAGVEAVDAQVAEKDA